MAGMGDVRDDQCRRHIILLHDVNGGCGEGPFGEQGQSRQQRGTSKRHANRQIPDEALSVLLPSDMGMSDPAIKGNAWNMNYARVACVNELLEYVQPR